ncbi:hypothetical protein O6H91_07G053900 [Diphasiastrum complanatum]|uniref:Uncharacterized protein n=2 Tax=Diphasiastrum complanatum TaxID=34168 RepID=A0ACC2D5I6_DIPCM|nr:hypothetical protein O6H91_07G053900 [Diphasiastrum complanatum]KAJ7549460.1 hypothetical protein O6H91_07G053900 [Diphasiastrum complanatum]
MALRHQVASTEPVKLLNGKSSSRIFKGDYALENGKRFSGIRITHSEVRTALSMPEGKIKPGCPTLKSKLLMADDKGEESPKGPLKEDTMDRQNESLQIKDLWGDVLPLQWGQRKRQRNGRFEIKAAAAEESSAFSEKSAKIVGSPTVTKKHDRSPPAQPARPNRGPASRPSNPAVRETTCANKLSLSDSAYFSTPNICNGSIVSNEKPKVRGAPPSPEKLDTITSHNRTVSGNSFAMNAAEGGADIEVNQGQEAPVLEKVDWESLELPKIVISLSRKEKEDDFLAFRGSKLPQRPKKRQKQVEKSLQYVMAGMWLPDLTKERYEVREKKAVKKRSRGLKGMGSVNTYSE